MKKTVFLRFFIAVSLFLTPLTSLATNGSGACSWHGGVDCSAGTDRDGSVICNDGWRGSSVKYSDVAECNKEPSVYFFENADDYHLFLEQTLSRFENDALSWVNKIKSTKTITEVNTLHTAFVNTKLIPTQTLLISFSCKCTWKLAMEDDGVNARFVSAFNTVTSAKDARIAELSSPTIKTGTIVSIDSSFIERMNGRILLQVEDLGKAWYVRDDGRRYYMKDGTAAYGMMRSFGLGITDADLSKIPAVNDADDMKEQVSACSYNELGNRLKGKILLQVQQHGEAWYVHPDKCRRIYLKDGTTAYAIMRYLSLGISNSDIDGIAIGTME